VGDNYKAALLEAQGELERIERRRAVLVRLIHNLRELSQKDSYELEPPAGYVPQGLTEEVRTILGITWDPLSAPEIRDHLTKRGIQSSSAKNLLISVHTVLGRLIDAGELTTYTKGGKAAYRLKVKSGMDQTRRQIQEMYKSAKEEGRD
jgi:hypothetical protein